MKSPAIPITAAPLIAIILTVIIKGLSQGVVLENSLINSHWFRKISGCLNAMPMLII
jgi:hypothetical protein